MQTTTRLKEGLPSLRHARELVVVRRAIDAASARPEFRVIHHSVQSNHLHLIVEARDRAALSMGMRALQVRIARSLNRLWGRAGSVFADRFHERALKSPSEVRNSLVYVLQNARKHGIAASGPDGYSSGPWFDGWQDMPGLREALERQRVRIETRFAEVWGVLLAAPGLERSCGPRLACSPAPGRARSPAPGCAAPPAPGLEPAEPTTWLLRIGWRRKGLLDPDERPCAPRRSAASAIR